jgi:UDP-glucose 4-epimerase
MASIWVTGGRGFIGRHLARHMAGRGHSVMGLGHGAWAQAEAAHWGMSGWINGEVTSSNLGQMRRIWGEPDTIFHLAGGSSVGAAIANPQEDFMRTVVSTSGLLEWVRQQAPAARIVAVSSAAVYGAGRDGAIDEETRLVPFSPYGYHKLMMETLCRSYAANFGLRIALPRLFSVYGPELKKQLLWDLCCKVAAGGRVELGGTGNEMRDWTEVHDVARALEQIAGLASEEAPVLNIATGVATPIREIAAIAALHWQENGNPGNIFFTGQPRPGDPFSLVANISRMREHGIECAIPVSEGVAKYVDWYKSGVMGTR